MSFKKSLSGNRNAISKKTNIRKQDVEKKQKEGFSEKKFKEKVEKYIRKLDPLEYTFDEVRDEVTNWEDKVNYDTECNIFDDVTNELENEGLIEITKDKNDEMILRKFKHPEISTIDVSDISEENIENLFPIMDKAKEERRGAYEYIAGTLIEEIGRIKKVRKIEEIRKNRVSLERINDILEVLEDEDKEDSAIKDLITYFEAKKKSLKIKQA